LAEPTEEMISRVEGAADMIDKMEEGKVEERKEDEKESGFFRAVFDP